MRKKLCLRCAAFITVLLIMILVCSCGRKKVPYEKNLLKNPSFEEFKDGIPKGWVLSGFHGLEGEKEVEYGASTTEAYDGEKSFYLKGEEDTKRWFVLSQEVKVAGITHIRLRGAIKLKDIIRGEGHYTQANFILAYFDKKHHRFQEMRLADKRTEVRYGTYNWFVEDKIFRVPSNTAYIAFSCILGMQGTIWFDDVSLEVPTALAWHKKSTKNFDFYWMAEREFPEGAILNEQRIFDGYCKMMGVKSDIRISYFLYPDTASIRRILSLKGVMYLSYDDREIHTINPNNMHEIVHMITDEYGKPPSAIAEGHAYYMMGGISDEPVHQVAKKMLLEKGLPPLSTLLDYAELMHIPMDSSVGATASFVGYLVEVWGPERLLDLFREASGANTYSTFASSFEKVYRLPLDKVEERWKMFLLRFEVEPILPDTTLSKE